MICRNDAHCHEEHRVGRVIVMVHVCHKAKGHKERHECNGRQRGCGIQWNRKQRKKAKEQS